VWIHTIARNSDSIIDGVLGNAKFGAKDISETATEYLKVARSNQNFFRSPKVVFDFLHPIDDDLETILEEKGIILGRKFQETAVMDDEKDSKFNLCITTLIALVSELTNGDSFATFREKLLQEQAAQERKEPVKAKLEKLFENKELICCETAWKSFVDIIKLLGGENERRRMEELKLRLTVLPDVQNPEQVLPIEVSAQIKERSRLIFAFGVAHRAVTVTSNAGFKRACNMRNLMIPTVIHSARALTENKAM